MNAPMAKRMVLSDVDIGPTQPHVHSGGTPSRVYDGWIQRVSTWGVLTRRARHGVVRPACLSIAVLVPTLALTLTLAPLLTLTPLLIVLPHDGVTRLVTIFLLLKLMLLLHLLGIALS